MTMPSYFRGKERSIFVRHPLDEIQINTVPNPEPLGLSLELQYGYFLIICDRYSLIFRLIGIRDRLSDACIDGIELLTSNIPTKERRIWSINDMRSNSGSDFRCDTFRKRCSERKIRFATTAPKHQE